MIQKKNKILKFINNNKIYIFSFLFAFLLLFLLMNNVTMYADDFILKVHSQKSFGGIFKYFISNYLTWGGGYTPLIVTVLFKLGFNAWKIVNTLIITSLFFLIAKVLAKNQKNFLINFTICWLLFYSISIFIVRECVYWLDGSMAYVISSFELFMYIYILYTRFVLKKERKYDVVLVPIVAFFSGWSNAQIGGTTLIISIIFFIWYKFIKHNKINKKFLLFIIFSFLGAAIFFLSPGNGARMITYEFFSKLGIIDKILFRASNITNLTFNYKQYPFAEMPLYIYLFSYLILYLSINQVKKSTNKKEKVIVLISTLGQMAFLMLTIIINFMPSDSLLNHTFTFANLYELKISNQLSIMNFLPYFVLIMFLIFNFITIIIHSKSEKNILLLILFIAIYSLQYSMLLAPDSPLRTCLTTVILLIFAIIYLINYLNSQKFDFSEIIVIIFMYININLAIVFYVFINIIKKHEELKKIILIIMLIPLIYTTIYNYKNMYVNYSENKKIYSYNINRLKKYRKGDKTIYLKRLKDETYAFTSIIGYDWIEQDVKLYFNIPKEVILKYEGD